MSLNPAKLSSLADKLEQEEADKKAELEAAVIELEAVQKEKARAKKKSKDVD